MAKREIEFNKNRKLTDQWCECAQDFVLPDFNSDIRKVLLFNATAYPASAFPSGEYLECSGVVTFDLVYLNFDGEAESTSFNGDYNFKVKCLTDDLVDSLVDTKVSAVALRLLSPRKISAKANLSSSVELILHDVRCSEGTALDEGHNPELLEKKVMIRDTKLSEIHEREYAESITRFDDKTTDEVTLLYSYVEPIIEQVEMEGSDARVRGRLKASVLVKTDDTPMYKLEHTIPIDETIKIDSVSENCTAKAKIGLASVNATTRGDDTGVDIILNVICEFRVVGEENKECTLLSDAYLCSCACDNSYDDFTYNEYLKRVDEVREKTEKISIEGLEYDTIRDVVFVSATPRIDEYVMDDGNLNIKGEIKVSAIATEIKDDESIEYTNLKFGVKIDENVNLGCHICDKLDVYPTISVSDVTCEVDTNNVYIKFNEHILFDLVAQKNARSLLVSNAKDDELFDKSPARITVYYPSPEDTLYSVAKEFHTTREKVLLDNSLAIETATKDGDDIPLVGVKRIIIT
jgi:hypothetical protein